MGMREFEHLKDIVIPQEQERIVDIFCEAWEECLRTHCSNCPDRPTHLMSLAECIALKYSRLLVEAEYIPVVHGAWLNCNGGNGTCSRCGIRQKVVYDDDSEQHYCGHCGAKMDGGKNA